MQLILLIMLWKLICPAHPFYAISFINNVIKMNSSFKKSLKNVEHIDFIIFYYCTFIVLYAENKFIEKFITRTVFRYFCDTFTYIFFRSINYSCIIYFFILRIRCSRIWLSIYSLETYMYVYNVQQICNTNNIYIFF